MKRRSRRVAELKKSAALTPNPTRNADRSRETRAKARALRADDANEKDIENNNGKVSLSEMETQVISNDDFDYDEEEEDVDDTNSSDRTGNTSPSTSTCKDDMISVEDFEVDKKAVSKPSDRKKSDDGSNSDKENDKASTDGKESKKTADIDEMDADEDKQENEEDQAKSEWLGMALGLRRSASKSPENITKSQSKIKGSVKDSRTKSTKTSPTQKDRPQTKKTDKAVDDSKKKQISAEPVASSSKASVSSKEPDEKSDNTLQKDSVDTSVQSAKSNLDEIKSATEPESTTVSEVAPGKLRSSVADAEGLSLARAYKDVLKETAEFAQSYISENVHLPVISCFRELNRGDIRHIVGNNKLIKKSCNSQEQSILYLGLIDYLATANNNPFYGEANSNAKFSKNVAFTVKKILLDFKNIIGMWALSGDDVLSSRYSLIIRYLRTLIPMFHKAEFDKEFSSIIDCIEKEVNRLKSNQDKLKAMNGPMPGSSSPALPSEKKPLTSASTVPSETEIILNVNLSINDDENDSEDDDILLIGKDKIETPKIFGKPIKPSPKTSSIKKPRIKKIPSTGNDPKISKSAQNSGSSTSLLQHKKLKAAESGGSTKSSSSASRNVSEKRSATEELSKPNDKSGNDPNKKLKLGESSGSDQSSPLSSRNEKAASGIRNYFQIQKVETTNSNSETSDSPVSKPKPINAFALMMQRSREIAEQKKQAAASGKSPTGLKQIKTSKVGTLKT